jgi:hypothetical protein
MDATTRKRIGVITKYVVANFSSDDWITLGQMTGQLPKIEGHTRLLRALGFGDDDYAMHAARILSEILERDEALVHDVIDHFDIELWYEQTSPEKYRKVFGSTGSVAPTFWKPNCLRLFLSHLSASRRKATALKASLDAWGISAFIAHQDIEPTKEWQTEIEAALSTMDVLVALLEPGFRDSAWTDQEVGYALGRNIDAVPLLIGVDPHGFIGKIQGIHVKGKVPGKVGNELVLALVKRPRLRDKLLSGLARALASSDPLPRQEKIRVLDGVIPDPQMKGLLEGAALTGADKNALDALIGRVGAFTKVVQSVTDDDIPF